MGQFVKQHPFVILAAGAAIQLLAGIPTAWGVFQEPVRAEYGLDEESASFVLSWLVAAFGAGGVAGGFLQDKLGPRFAALLGSAGLCAGFVAAGFVPTEKPWLFYLAFSAPVGAGCAFLYPAVMGCAQKWYADRKGLATGVIGVAVGLSGAALTLLVKWFTGLWGIRGCFFALGALLGLVCGGASLVLQNPEKAPAAPKQQGMTPGEMLRTAAYWWITASVALATPAVLPSLCTERFGLAHTGVNYGLLALGMAAGSLGFPFAAKAFGLEAGRHWLAVGAALAGAFCLWKLGPEQGRGRPQ